MYKKRLIEQELFAYRPFFYRGNSFWLTKIKITKAFNGRKMRTINIEKLR